MLLSSCIIAIEDDPGTFGLDSDWIAIGSPSTLLISIGTVEDPETISVGSACIKLATYDALEKLGEIICSVLALLISTGTDKDKDCRRNLLGGGSNLSLSRRARWPN